MSEEIEKIAENIADIEQIFVTYSAESWDKHRRRKPGAFNAFSLDKLAEQKNLLQQKEIILLAQNASLTGKRNHNLFDAFPNLIFTMLSSVSLSLLISIIWKSKILLQRETSIT